MPDQKMLSDWLSQILPFVLSNFALSMFAAAAFFMLLHRLVTRGRVSEYEIIYRWLAFFALGGTNFYAFAMNMYYPDVTASTLQWQTSPFQFEIAMASLAFGVLAILSFNASYGFRLATVIGNIFWLWGCAASHVLQVMKIETFSLVSLSGAGSWFWIDVLLPLILLACVSKLRPVIVK